MAKIERIRFTTDDDLRLLRDVVGLNPFDDPSRWKVIQNNLCKISEKGFSLRAVREHVEHLSKLFVKEDRSNLRKSGTEEQYIEKEKLLQEIADLQREFKNKANKKEAKLECIIREKGIAARNQACSLDGNVAAQREETIIIDFPEYSQYDDDSNVENDLNAANVEAGENENRGSEVDDEEQTAPAPKNSVVFGPVRTRKQRLPTKYGGIHYLKEKQEWERKVREKEIDLEDRKLALEERRVKLEELKFEMDKKERESRLAIELREREQNLEVAKQQLTTIHFFMDHFVNSNK